MLFRSPRGYCQFMGYVIEFGGWKIYHSGDTLWFDEMVSILKPFKVDIALLPINGNISSRGVAGNLNCREAVLLGKAMDARYVIPCHYDMFAFNTANIDEFINNAQSVDQPVAVLKQGQSWGSGYFA